MALLRSILFVLIFYPGSVVMVLAALASIPFGQEAIIASSRRWAIWHRWCARWILGIRTRVIGDLPTHGVLYALKHEAMFETIETLVIFHRPVVVMKKELADMFGWGYAARRMGVIPVDREAGAAARKG